MASKDLKAFGEKLSQLRKTVGLYQEELAQKLSLIHARVNPNSDLRIDGNRISKWEHAFKSKSGQEWRPKRQQLLYLIEVFAEQLTLEAAREWALQAGYHFSKEDLQLILSPRLDQSTIADPSSPNFHLNLKNLDFIPNQHLFGVSEVQKQLSLTLQQHDAPWIVAIDGIGGIGKTSLAGAVARELLPIDRFVDIVWISAKREEFLLSTGIRPVDRLALSVDDLATTLLEQLNETSSFSHSSLEEKVAHVTSVLKQNPYLIVIDNLETVADYEALLPLLRRLAQPSKFLLTSRHSLYAYPDIFCFSLEELDRISTFALLRYEAEVRGLSLLVNASEAQLTNIYNVAGGNPLALKLIIGQIHILPLSHILENLKQAQGRKTEDLYTYIYWEAWQALDDFSRKVLLVMPLAQGGTLAQLAMVSELTMVELSQALEHLVTLSLVDTYGDIEQRRYRIHRLTETFLLTEVIKWQQRL